MRGDRRNQWLAERPLLLSILAGALRADSGSIRINGTEILGRSGAAADLTAYVPQENPLMGELSVKDNLLLWHRGSRKEMERDLTEGCSSVLGIGPMLKKRVDTLSGGMKKRLSIACALSGRAPVLIMDEPGAALDLECKRDIQAYRRSLHGGRRDWRSLPPMKWRSWTCVPVCTS